RPARWRGISPARRTPAWHARRTDRDPEAPRPVQCLPHAQGAPPAWRGALRGWPPRASRPRLRYAPAIRTVHRALLIERDRRPVLLQKQRAIEINEVAPLRDQTAWRHGEGCAFHAADHGLHAEPADLRRHGQRFGKATTLVELDVYDLEQSNGLREVAEPLYALVRPQWDRRAEVGELMLTAHAHRLLDQPHVRLEQRWQNGAQRRDVISLIGIDSYPDIRPCSPHRAHARPVVLTGQLQLEARGAAV